MWFTWSPTGFAAAAKSSINWPKAPTYRCFSAPCISVSLVSISENWTATEVHTCSALQACKLPACYEQELARVTSFCKIVHMYMRLGSTQRKTAFYKGYRKIDNGWINVQNEWKAGIHNWLTNLLVLFSKLLVYNWRTEGKQSTKISIR